MNSLDNTVYINICNTDLEDALKTDVAKQELLKRIQDMRPGTRLPNRIALAKSLNVSRTTLERAISELIAMGYLSSQDGSGTYVQIPVQQKMDWTKIPDKPKTNDRCWTLLVNSIVNDVYPHLLRGVEDVAHENDISLMICNTDNLVSKQNEYLYKHALRGVSGVILVPAIKGDMDLNVFRALRQNGIPVVCCNRPIPGFGTPGVYLNSFEMGLKGTQHLIDCGCKRIAYMGSCLYSGAFERYQGYMAAMHMNGLAARREWVSFEADNDYEISLLPEAQRILDAEPAFEGIFAFNDRLARVLYQLLRQRGVEPGRDVQIVSCDNTSLAETLDPRLTSIRFPAYEMGAQCARLLLSMESGMPSSGLYMSTVECEVVVRSSTRPCPNKKSEQE